MTSPQDRIKELARSRAIGEADAERLLDAVRPARPTSRNPFERWSGEVMSIAGLVVAAAGLATSRLGVRYDGALDLHVTGGAIPLRIALIDQVVAFGLTALVLWGLGRPFARHARLVDVLGAVGVSRAPAVIVAVPLSVLVPLLHVDPTRPGLGVLLVALIALAGVGIQIFLLVLGFRTATGLRGGRLAATFIGALVAAEVVTKLALAALV